MCPSPKKKAKTVLPTPTLRLQSNKQLTIRTTKVSKKPPAASPKPLILTQAKSSDLRRGTQSILLSNNNLRPSLIQTKNNSAGLIATLGKHTTVSAATSSNPMFIQKKFSADEITIVPINIKDPKRSESSSKIFLGSVKLDPKPSVIKPNCDSSRTAIAKPIQLIKPAKRVAPTKISDDFTIRANSLEKSSDSDMLSRDSSVATNDEASTSSINQQNGLVTAPNDTELAKPEKKRRKEEEPEQTPLNAQFQSLIDACRVVDNTDGMERLITKLIKYYRSVHPNFINSKSFCKRVEETASQVKAHPSLVIVQIKDIFEELKQRRLNDTNIVPVDVDEEPSKIPSTTGDAAKDRKILRLSKALYTLKKLIMENEQVFILLDFLKKKKYIKI